MAKTPSRKKTSSTRPALTLAHQAAHEPLLPLILSFPPTAETAKATGAALPAKTSKAAKTTGAEAPAAKAVAAPETTVSGGVVSENSDTMQSGAAPTSPSAGISPEERHQLIARHAFQRAQRRGLGSTDPLHDWLIAEREINALLTGGVASLSV